MDHVTIDELTAPHFELVAGWLSRPDINRWLTSDWRDRTVSANLIAVVARNPRNRLFLVRCVGRPAGLAALAEIDPADRTAMLWYVLGEEECAGQGITTSGVRKLAHLSFGATGLASLYAWVMADNTASQRVLEKVGFRNAGRIRASTSSGGRQVDRILYDLLPGEVG